MEAEEAVQHQSHNKFKIFVGTIGENNSIDEIAGQVEKFVADNNAAAKSIGAEYLESAGSLVLTLGYRTDEPSYPVKLSADLLGKADMLGGDFSALESKMGEAAATHKEIICHELFITSEGNFLMVFMTLA
jgi:hypothetical protein